MTTRTRKGSPSQPQRRTVTRKTSAKTEQTENQTTHRRSAPGGWGIGGFTGAQPEIEKPTKSAQAIADRELERIRGKKK